MARASSSELQVALQVDHPATTSPRPARCTHSAFRPSPELSRRLLWRGSLPMWVGGPNLERILEALAGVCGRSTWDASPRSASPRHARASSQTEARPQREPQRRQLPPWLSLALFLLRSFGARGCRRCACPRRGQRWSGALLPHLPELSAPPPPCGSSGQRSLFGGVRGGGHLPMRRCPAAPRCVGVSVGCVRGRVLIPDPPSNPAAWR